MGIEISDGLGRTYSGKVRQAIPEKNTNTPFDRYETFKNNSANINYAC